MILNEITLTNFGVFRGEHRAMLTPPSDDRPVILFGGLNGGGKTTLLEAIQLALYGKMADTSRQNGWSYEEYLQRSIHRGVALSDGASVELAFTVHEEGAIRQYRVRRTWSMPGRRIKEYLDVFVDERRDELLSGTWQEQVERFIPSKLAPLFFFDGERIETLADPDQSAAVLTKAIYALLGVDLVDQLSVDLQAIERRKRKDAVDTVDLEEIDLLEKELKQAMERLDLLQQDAASVRSQLGMRKKELADAERRFKAHGGDLLEVRKKIEQQRDQIASDAKATRDHLIDLTSGVLPLSLVSDAIERIQASGREAADMLFLNRLRGEIKQRYDQLLEALEQEGVSRGAIDAVSRMMGDDPALQGEKSAQKLEVQLSESVLKQIKDLHQRVLPHDCELAERLVADLDRQEDVLEQFDRKLASVPDEDAVAEQIAQREQAIEALQQAEIKLSHLEPEIERAQSSRNQLRDKLDSRLRAVKFAAIEQKDAERIVKYASKTRDILHAYRDRIVADHASQLEELILKGYQQLLRKKSLMRRIAIDSSNCSLTMYDRDDNVITPDRLSAGERQLLAVSMLWGLGKASQRPMPIVVDTPLGRLDSTHRQHLIQRYFPAASHQVLLLSTDEEIDRESLELLRPAVGRSYLLSYDDKTGSSAILDGYFWEEACHAD